MERQRLTSTSVVSAGYEADGGLLELEFKGGRLYRYRDVPSGVFEWLLRTPNKGAYVQRMIADRYAYEAVPVSDEGVSEAEMSLLEALQASLAEADRQNPARGEE